MAFLPPLIDPPFLAFLAVLAAAAGADLALAIALLGVMPSLGWASPPAELRLLQSPLVVLSVTGLYVAEAFIERFPAGFALWHTFQRWLRFLGLLLLLLLATAELRGLERGVLVGMATLLGIGVYMGSSGWQGVLVLRRLPRRSQWLNALAIDVAFGALLVLGLDEPLQAFIALGLLLVLAAHQLPLALQAHLALVRGGRAWLRALLLPGRWVPEESLPAWVRSGAASHGPVPGRPLRGARATLLTRHVRLGWLVLASEGPVFVGKGQAPIPLSAVPDTVAVWGPLHVRKPVRAGTQEGELLVLKDGPRLGDLEAMIR